MASPPTPADRLLADLRHARRRHREGQVAPPPLTRGQRFADTVTRLVGSWRFIIVRSTILVLWIAANITAWRNGAA